MIYLRDWLASIVSCQQLEQVESHQKVQNFTISKKEQQNVLADNLSLFVFCCMFSFCLFFLENRSNMTVIMKCHINDFMLRIAHK